MVQNEVSPMKNAQTAMRAETLETLDSFSWGTVLADELNNALFSTLLMTAITNRKSKDALVNDNKNTKPGLGLILSVLL